MEQIRGFLPFSRSWLEHRLGISEPKELMLIKADQDLAPEIRKMDLLLVDRSAGNKLPRGDGLYVFSVPTGLAVRRVEIGLKRGFVITGPGISEEMAPSEIERLLVGRAPASTSISLAAFNSFRVAVSGDSYGRTFSTGIPDACDNLSASVSLSTLHSRIQE